MNVLHLSTHVDLGGITSYIATLSKALALRGHRSAVFSGGGNASTLLTRAGVSCYRVPVRTKNEFNPALWLSLPQTVSLVRQEHIALMHAHTRVMQVYAAFVSLCTGVPYVSTAHGFYKPHIGRRFFPAWGRRVIAISPLVAESLERSHHVPHEKIRIVQNAVDLESFKRSLAQKDRRRLKQRYGIPERAFVIGSLSRLVRDKGHGYLIEAVRQVALDHPDAYLLIVGDGREKEALVRQAGEVLPGRAKFIAGVQDTTTVLSMMDVFAHPATTKEGFGLSVAEAMVAKIPVVATDIPALNTLLKDGENGRLVAPKNAAALAEALRELIRDPKLARRFGERGYETAAALCRPERMAAEIEDVYREITDNAHAGSSSHLI